MQLTIWWNCQCLTHTHSEFNPSILCPRSGPVAPVSVYSHLLNCTAIILQRVISLKPADMKDYDMFLCEKCLDFFYLH